MLMLKAETRRGVMERGGGHAEEKVNNGDARRAKANNDQEVVIKCERRSRWRA